MEEEELKLCENNCGNVLTGQQTKYCSRKCKNENNYIYVRGKNKEPDTFPKWKCPKGCIVEVPFKIVGNGKCARRFDKFKEEHICQK